MIIKVLIVCIFALVSLMVGVSTYWMLETPKPPSVSIEQSARGPDGKPQTKFKAGEVLYIFSKQRTLRDIKRSATQSIWREDGIDALAVRYGTLLSPTPTQEGITFPVQLPTYLEAGNYTHRVKIEYRQNPLQEAEFHLPNVKFSIER